MIDYWIAPSGVVCANLRCDVSRNWSGEVVMKVNWGAVSGRSRNSTYLALVYSRVGSRSVRMVYLLRHPHASPRVHRVFSATSMLCDHTLYSCQTLCHRACFAITFSCVNRTHVMYETYIQLLTENSVLELYQRACSVSADMTSGPQRFWETAAETLTEYLWILTVSLASRSSTRILKLMVIRTTLNWE